MRSRLQLLDSMKNASECILRAKRQLEFNPKPDIHSSVAMMFDLQRASNLLEFVEQQIKSSVSQEKEN